MKDWIITANRQKKEFLMWVICFVLAFILNIVAIAIYNTEWKELWTQIGYVFFISILFYFMSGFFRLGINLITRNRKKKRRKISRP